MATLTSHAFSMPDTALHVESTPNTFSVTYRAALHVGKEPCPEDIEVDFDMYHVIYGLITS